VGFDGAGTDQLLASGGGVVLPAESRTPSGVRPLLWVALPGEAAAGCERCSLGELG
jgi:hypothetical protein